MCLLLNLHSVHFCLNGNWQCKIVNFYWIIVWLKLSKWQIWLLFLSGPRHYSRMLAEYAGIKINVLIMFSSISYKTPVSVCNLARSVEIILYCVCLCDSLLFVIFLIEWWKLIVVFLYLDCVPLRTMEIQEVNQWMWWIS